MTSALVSVEKMAVMAYLAWDSPDGPFVEVGVYQGGSASRLYDVAQSQGRKLWLYDTFYGIPYRDEDKGDTHKIGDFKETSYDEIVKQFPEAIVQQGVFSSAQRLPMDIAFVHLDVDQYRSYREALDILMPLMAKGGQILCDDYCLAGARQAIDETGAWKKTLPDGRMLMRF